MSNGLPTIEIYDVKNQESVDPTNYDITYQGDISLPGIKEIIATGKNQYGGAIKKQFEIYVDISKTTIALGQQDYIFTGQQVIPDVTVKLGSQTIIQRYPDGYEPYTLNVNSARDVGSHTVRVIGRLIKGHREEKEASFHISQANINACSIQSGLQDAYWYHGSAITPHEITIALNGVLMSESDFRIEFPDDDYVDFGRKKIALVGQNNLNSTLEKYFSILGNLNDAIFSDEQPLKFKYTGEPIKHSYSYKILERLLVKGVDYTELFSDDEPDPTKKFIYPGYKDVTISEHGYCKNSKTFRYSVYGDIAECTTIGFKKFVQQDGTPKKQDDFQVVFHGKVIERGVDYDLQFDDSVDYSSVGYKKVTIVGVDQLLYIGQLELQYYVSGDTTTIVSFNDGSIAVGEYDTTITKKILEDLSK